MLIPPVFPGFRWEKSLRNAAGTGAPDFHKSCQYGAKTYPEAASDPCRINQTKPMKAKSHSGFLRRSYQLPVLAALSCAAFGTGSLHASFLLVDWGGDYLQNTAEFSGSYTNQDGLNFDGGPVANDSRFGFAYNAAAPAVLSPPSPYSGTSGTFYGGFVVNTLNQVDTNGLQPNAMGVHQNGPEDYIKFQTQHSGNHDHTFALFMYWDKSDFLNGGSDGAISLDNLSSFSLNIRNSSNFTADAHLHFVIRNGSQFYTSQAFYNGDGASGEEGFLGQVPDGGIATYNPSVGGFGWKAYNPDGLDLQWSHGGYENPTFDNITAVGFYFDTLVFGQGNNTIDITNFSFSAVPEPSSALIALGGLGTLLLHRRRA